MATYLAVIRNAWDGRSNGFCEKDEFYIQAGSPREAVRVANTEWTNRVKPMRPRSEITSIEVFSGWSNPLGSPLAEAVFDPLPRDCNPSGEHGGNRFTVFVFNADDTCVDAAGLVDEDCFFCDEFVIAANTAEEAIDIAYAEWVDRIGPMRPACEVAFIEVWPEDHDANEECRLAEKSFRLTWCEPAAAG